MALIHAPHSVASWAPAARSKTGCRGPRCSAPRCGRRALKEVEYLPDLFIQVGRLEPQLPHLGKAEEIVEQVLQPLALALDHFDLGQSAAVTRSLFGPEVLGQQLHVQPDRRKRVL